MRKFGFLVGRLWSVGSLWLSSSLLLPFQAFAFQDFSPTPEEFEVAVAILRQDPAFGTRADQWTAYEALPPVLKLSGEFASDRILLIGIFPSEPPSDDPELSPTMVGEIVGVNLSRQRVHRFPDRAPLASPYLNSNRSAYAEANAEWKALALKTPLHCGIPKRSPSQDNSTR